MDPAERRMRPSQRNMPQLLIYLAKVAVQDSLVLCRKYPEHPVVSFLLRQPQFTYALQHPDQRLLPAHCLRGAASMQPCSHHKPHVDQQVVQAPGIVHQVTG